MKIELGEKYKKKRAKLEEDLRNINKEIKDLVSAEAESNKINGMKGKKVIINNRKQDPFYFDHIEPTPYRVVMVYGYAVKKDGTQSKNIRTYISSEGDSLNEVVDSEESEE